MKITGLSVPYNDGRLFGDNIHHEMIDRNFFSVVIVVAAVVAVVLVELLVAVVADA